MNTIENRRMNLWMKILCLRNGTIINSEIRNKTKGLVITPIITKKPIKAAKDAVNPKYRYIFDVLGFDSISFFSK
jgi:hypothetical protein